jgi:hypothetical protein
MNRTELPIVLPETVALAGNSVFEMDNRAPCRFDRKRQHSRYGDQKQYIKDYFASDGYRIA